MEVSSREKLERESGYGDFVLGTLIDGDIYHCDWNEETRPTVVLKHDKVAEPPLHRRGAHGLALFLTRE